MYLYNTFIVSYMSSNDLLICVLLYIGQIIAYMSMRPFILIPNNSMHKSLKKFPLNLCYNNGLDDKQRIIMLNIFRSIYITLHIFDIYGKVGYPKKKKKNFFLQTGFVQK